MAFITHYSDTADHLVRLLAKNDVTRDSIMESDDPSFAVMVRTAHDDIDLDGDERRLYKGGKLVRVIQDSDGIF